ncbi:hypothetical protein H4R34_006195, partial [Dimargaris verticillata]
FMGKDCPLCDDNGNQPPLTSQWVTASRRQSPPSVWVGAPRSVSAHHQSLQRHGNPEWVTKSNTNALAPISTDVNTAAQGLVMTMRWSPSCQPAEVHHVANDSGLDIWATDSPQTTKRVLFVREKRDANVFSRHMAVPEGFDTEKCTLEYRDGVLKAVFPRKAPTYAR